jgi:TatD DNase family protein
MRGKKNEPSFIKYTAEKLSLIKNDTLENIIKMTSNNFNILFGK